MREWVPTTRCFLDRERISHREMSRGVQVGVGYVDGWSIACESCQSSLVFDRRRLFGSCRMDGEARSSFTLHLGVVVVCVCIVRAYVLRRQQGMKLIEAGLACKLGGDLDNDVTCDCLKVRRFWQAFAFLGNPETRVLRGRGRWKGGVQPAKGAWACLRGSLCPTLSRGDLGLGMLLGSLVVLLRVVFRGGRRMIRLGRLWLVERGCALP